MKKFLYCFAVIFLYFMVTASMSWGLCLQPSQYAIGGSLTVDGIQITAGTDDGYVIQVRQEDGTEFENVDDDPTDDNGLNPSNNYTISIPVISDSEPSCNPGGAQDNDIVIIHVYHYGTEYKVVLPTDGEITVDTAASGVTVYNITAYSPRILDIEDPDHGSITPSPAAAGGEYPYDTEVTLTATPDNGYVFSSWTGDVDDPSSPTTFIIMDTDQNVSANFSQCSNTLTMAVNDSQMGSVTPAAGDNERACDAIVNITATPNSGYAFSSWTGDVANTSSRSTTVTMDTDQVVTANFVVSTDDDDPEDSDGGGGGGGGIFGEISIRDVLGYHFDGNNSNGVGVYMPVTNAYKALKGAQTHVESFAPNVASLVRRGFDILEKKAEKNKDGLLYRVGTYTFPVLGKIAEYYLDIVNAEKLKVDAYSDTTISIEDFKILEQQGKAVAPHMVNFENETETYKFPINK